MKAVKDVELLGVVSPGYDKILTAEALAFISGLQRKFNQVLLDLLRQQELDAGKLPDFPSETADVRDGSWQVAACPPDLLDRRVEITGPVERKMMINAFNSGANVFMADFEDSLSPTWANVVEGQINLLAVTKRTLTFASPEGKQYKLNDKIATMVVRPRGWHLVEKHVLVDGQPVSASLFDFGLFFFHNARLLLNSGSGPYFYLPKLESYMEARLWNDVFNYAQDELGIARGSIRATVLIETILAAFEMEEILYELRDHVSGLNAGRWDYMFSMIKKFRNHKQFVLPDRSQVTMTVPFMRSYCDMLVQTCHKRGAHAMGGMAAFIPSRKDSQVNEVALAAVRKDKHREANLGFDGTWVAHPDLVAVAREMFDNVLGTNPHQKDKPVSAIGVTAAHLLDTKIEGATITESGFRNNVSVALQYIESWLRGVGAAAIYNLMEDAATAEISRSQLWQWLWNESQLVDGTKITKDLYSKVRADELEALSKGNTGKFESAAKILDNLVLTPEYVEFLTIAAYEYLNC